MERKPLKSQHVFFLSRAILATTPPTIGKEFSYTGHEMLDELGLIHMNGRIYDPLLGRMLSADPNIQSPSELQNYNRYSYVLNNPLSLTDPSGFFFKKLFKSIGKFFKKFARPLIAIAIAAFTAGFAAIALGFAQGSLLTVTGSLFTGSAGLGFGASAAVGAIGGFAGGLVTGGLRGGLIGALTGGIAGAIGYAFSGVGKFANLQFKELARASAHGVTGGLVSEALGGEFGAGFAGSFAGSLAGHLGPDWNYVAIDVVQAAVAGGTVAEISGGKALRRFKVFLSWPMGLSTRIKS